VYPLVAKLLELDISQLKTGPIDGDLSVLRGILKEEAPAKEKKVSALAAP
jgi:hypothetical protein